MGTKPGNQHVAAGTWGPQSNNGKEERPNNKNKGVWGPNNVGLGNQNWGPAVGMSNQNHQWGGGKGGVGRCSRNVLGGGMG